MERTGSGKLLTLDRLTFTKMLAKFRMEELEKLPVFGENADNREFVFYTAGLLISSFYAALPFRDVRFSFI